MHETFHLIENQWKRGTGSCEEGKLNHCMAGVLELQALRCVAAAGRGAEGEAGGAEGQSPEAAGATPAGAGHRTATHAAGNAGKGQRCCWSLLYSAVLRSPADSLHSCCMGF